MRHTSCALVTGVQTLLFRSRYVQAECAAITFWHDHPEETAQIVERELGVDPQEAARMMRGTGVLPCRQQLTSAYLGQDGNAGAFARSLHPIARFLSGRGRIREVRSEEHTSELQSLMRISYAVFCLKKK